MRMVGGTFVTTPHDTLIHIAVGTRVVRPHHVVLYCSTAFNAVGAKKTQKRPTCLRCILSKELPEWWVLGRFSASP